MSTIEPFSYTYENLLSKGSHSQIIPTLQRPYTWDKKEIFKLWEDICENKEHYFLGSIVMIASGGSASRDHVIDGQQRLTTLSLFLIALRDMIAEKPGYEDLEDDILFLLSEPTHRDGAKNRLEFSDKKSDEIYSSLLKGATQIKQPTTVQKKFLDNYFSIREILENDIKKMSVKKIEKILSKIKNTEFIFISCSDGSAAYQLFQSINATGISLASTDLIKNSLFFLVSNNKTKLDSVEDTWTQLESQFEDNYSMLKTFLRHHWISRGQYTSHAGLYENFESQYIKSKDVEGAEHYIKEAVDLAKVYWSLRNAQVEDLENLSKIRFRKTNVKETLEFLSFLNVDQVYAPLLYLYSHRAKEFEKDLVKLTAFQFLFKYVLGSPAAIERLFAALSSKNKKSKKSREEVFGELIKICEPQRDTFVEKFSSKIKYVEGKSGDVQFILEKYIYHHGPKSKFHKPTIEHIIAKKPSQKVKKKIGLSGSELKNFLNQIGNLTILEFEENTAEARNDDFAVKNKLFKKSPYKINKKLEKYGFEEDPVRAVSLRNNDISEEVFDFCLNALKSGKWVR